MTRLVAGGLAAVLCAWGAVGTLCFGEDTQPNPAEYTALLAQNEVPSGLVVADHFLRGRTGPPRPDSPLAKKGAFRDSLLSRLDLFNRATGAFRALQKDGVVHVRSLEEPVEVTTALEREVRFAGALSVPAISAVVRHVVAALRGEEIGGIVGGGMLPGPECGVNQRVTVPEGPATPTAILDAIVLQAPGLAWIATYRPDAPKEYLELGLMCGDGSWVSMNVYPHP